MPTLGSGRSRRRRIVYEGRRAADGNLQALEFFGADRCGLVDVFDP